MTETCRIKASHNNEHTHGLICMFTIHCQTFWTKGNKKKKVLQDPNGKSTQADEYVACWRLNTNIQCFSCLAVDTSHNSTRKEQRFYGSHHGCLAGRMAIDIAECWSWSMAMIVMVDEMFHHRAIGCTNQHWEASKWLPITSNYDNRPCQQYIH